MKNLSKLILYLVILISPIVSYGQTTYLTICNSFDSNIVNITIDTAGIWEIGQPTKSVFDSSYAGANSIITDLDSLYPLNDTSYFYAVYSDDEWGGLPNYLGLYSPLEIEFNHRFISDSIADYGNIEMSLDDGITWYSVLSSEYNADWGEDNYLNEHFFEGSGDTIFDSLTVTGNSNGWVHSKFSKDIENIIYNDNIYPDSVILKFSFITDSIGRNEGWQIDNLCISMDVISGITKNQSVKELSIYPNPNNGEFSIPENSDVGELRIYNLLGKEVYSKTITKDNVSTNLPPGIYVLVLNQGETIFTTRMVIK